jgi:inosine/xanthosine triphosphatase
MRVNVGSTNRTKIEAVEEVLKSYPEFAEAEVMGVEVPVEEFGHPKTLAETVEGAMRRAKEAFRDCELSFGIEGGLIDVPHTKTGVMEIAVCAIYDGKTYHLGISPAFEWPRKVAKLIIDGMDGSRAFREAGFTTHEKIGTAEGAIWTLTKGKMKRKDYNKIAVTMALVHLNHPEDYK